MQCRIPLSIFSILLCLSICITRSEAQAAGTIRVTGSGAANASPNQVIVRGTLMASDESVEDAAKNFAEAKNAFEKVIGGDTHPELTVEFAGEKLATGGAMDAAAAFAVPDDFGGPVEIDAAGQQFSLSEDVVLRLAIKSEMEREGITKKLGGVIDAATKAGLSLGNAPNAMFAAMGMSGASSIVQFELDEKGQTALRSRAYKAAFNDARARAAALAELSGGRLGKVVSVEEVTTKETGNDLETLQMNMLSRMFGGAVGAARDGIDYNGQIEQTQDLVVTFELVE